MEAELGLLQGVAHIGLVCSGLLGLGGVNELLGKGVGGIGDGAGQVGWRLGGGGRLLWARVRARVRVRM